MRWPWIWRQPAPDDELNEPDDEHTVRVPTRGRHTPTGFQEDEAVWATPAAAEQWDARRWRENP